MAQIFEPSTPVNRNKIMGEGRKNTGNGKRENTTVGKKVEKYPSTSKTTLKRGVYNG
jgi:hypothetical protein